jgi:hypothetical protein
MADRKVGGSAGNRGKGRKKGVPNKATAALKDAILNAFSQVGGEAYLVTVAKTDPKTFCTLLGKVLPLQVTGADDGPVKLVVEWQRPE